jgi:hypothetical protein
LCLERKLTNIKRQLDKEKYQKVNHIAVIVDVDFPSENKIVNKEKDGGKVNRLYQISKAINKVFNTNLDFEQSGEGNIIKTEIVLDEDVTITDFHFSCFLTKNAEQEGNLDYLLKDLALKKEEAHHANCLTAWQNCLQIKGKNISPNYITKLWLDYYIRFDTSTTKEKSNAEVKLKFSTVMKDKGEQIFSFEHPTLKPFKDYFSKILID